MSHTASAQPEILADLGQGLLLRRSTPADAEALAEFNKYIHRDPGVIEPDEGVAAWTRDLLLRPHPTFAPNDFTIVAEAETGRIVSSLNLISQTWSYAGLPFKVGRPELVGTAPEYRNRGLVRAQFEVIHQWSAARGELAQGITGIPYYYRQFGYEMALALGGGRRGYPAELPAPKEGQEEPFHLRAVTEADLAFVMALDAQNARASLVYCVRDAAQWRYELFGKDPGNVNGLTWAILEDTRGEPAGLVGHSHHLEGGRLVVMYVALRAGLSWLAAAPSLLAALAAVGQRLAGPKGCGLAALAFGLGPEHPLYTAARDWLPHVRPSYAWYLRVPDLPAFVRQIAPVLEARLAASLAPGHTGELTLSFYRGGLRLAFDAGRLALAAPWQPAQNDDGSAAFPGLSFLQLLFGYRSLGELQEAFPDCWVDGAAPRALLEALFPKQPSRFWPLA
jgi:hypothetical protein